MASGNPRLRYHCVEVIAGPHACAAAQALGGQRLLSADAPRLPLATCDRSPDCGCIYRHFDDRRRGPRRSSERGRPTERWENAERRKRPADQREVDLD